MVNELICRLFDSSRSSRLALVGAVAMVVLLSACDKYAADKRAPVLNEDAKYRITGQYIVAFQPGAKREAFATAQRTVKKLGSKIRYSITSEPMWFSVENMSAGAVEAMRVMPGVAYIEQDQRGQGSTVVQEDPPYGLDRTSERFDSVPPIGIDERFTYSEEGSGVHVYVLDTGILTSHNEFDGRVDGPHVNCFLHSGSEECTLDTSTCNPPGCHGHGTHVAGIIGGTTYGIAKNVCLHSVRVLDSTNSPGEGTDVVAAGVAWVGDHAEHPAVVNMSFNWHEAGTPPTLLTQRVNELINNHNATVVISAGNYSDDAAGHWPGVLLPNAIIVGAINPLNDERWQHSSYGSSVDLFAPGVGIESASNGSDTDSITRSGTSMAAAHVSGVAALYLDSSNDATLPDKTPAAVKARIVDCDGGICVPNIFGTTPVWAGIINAGAGSPNKLLHWGSLEDGYMDGDPHIKTVNGVNYDFQGAGEYVSLRDQDGMEIQVRQAAIATTFNPPSNPYTGLATCVSLNTAVAARVGKHRVTYQPSISGDSDPSVLELRVDGEMVELGPEGLDLGSSGRVVKTVTGGIEIHFPNETILTVTPGWWASQSKWYLNVDVLRTRSKEGLMGAIRRGSWLPTLPGGTLLGPMPSALHERYIELYQEFGNAWRVTDKSSLFDYAPGTSTATFTLPGWPPESPPCDIPGTEPVKPTTQQRAEEACREITDKNRNANCVFDVAVTGNPGFAETYRHSQQIRAGSTTITLASDSDRDTTQVGEWVTFTAIVAPSALANGRVLTGAVQFSLVGSKVGEPVKLDSIGRATWETSRLKVGIHRVAAIYMPTRASAFLPSTSRERIHTVKRCYCESGSEHK